MAGWIPGQEAKRWVGRRMQAASSGGRGLLRVPASPESAGLATDRASGKPALKKP